MPLERPFVYVFRFPFYTIVTMLTLPHITGRTGARQGVAIDDLKQHLGLPWPTLLRPAGGPPLNRSYSRFKVGLPAGRVVCGRLLPPWTPHAVSL
jgi:hypothetical protein